MITYKGTEMLWSFINFSQLTLSFFFKEMNRDQSGQENFYVDDPKGFRGNYSVKKISFNHFSPVLDQAIVSWLFWFPLEATTPNKPC